MKEILTTIDTVQSVAEEVIFAITFPLKADLISSQGICKICHKFYNADQLKILDPCGHNVFNLQL